jgi:hypothetical protein
VVRRLRCNLPCIYGGAKHGNDRFRAFDRLMDHVCTMGLGEQGSLKDRGSRCISLLCFLQVRSNIDFVSTRTSGVWKATDHHWLQQACRPFQQPFLNLRLCSVAWHLVVFTDGLVRWCAASCIEPELTKVSAGDKLDPT